jgi:endonuclease/exonuclease/phosphatase family metal-dependent hydrolase
MNLLFWNINKKNLLDELPALTQECDTDILILAESTLLDSAILTALNVGKTRNFLLPLTLSDRIKIYARFNRDNVEAVLDVGGITIKHIKPPLGIDFILVAIHLSSKLYTEDLDHTSLSMRLSRMISEVEKKIGHERTVVIGDFNMNPFEDGLIAADGLHAVMDRSTALKQKRKVQGEERIFFYNPMWSLLGDISIGPPGTYYYSTSKQKSLFWNTFDQVLLRPSLLDYFSDNGVKVITNFNGTNLLKENGRPDSNNFSDHLPISINLTIEDT